jgi:Ca2+-transporting ATPase
VGSDEMIEITGTGFSATGHFVRAGGRVSPADVPWLRRLLVACALTSRASVGPDGKVVGDPTDAALTVLARKADIAAASLLSVLPSVRDIPFTSGRRSSASIHLDGERAVIFVKGAPATVLEWCTHRAVDNTDRELDPGARGAILEENERLAARGLRVIALASGQGDELRGLTLLGLVGIMDPPAEGVRETIALLRGAGIRTVVITGDQRATAEAVARDLGAFDEQHLAVDGRELRRMTDDEIASVDRPVGVFSRVSTEDKLRIVSALQARGEVVAMLGDGVNDAAALKKSDIGVAMGLRGTDVAKETADIVLRDDRFLTIGAAVEEGRVIFENIRKFVFYLFSCNLAEVLVLLVAGVAGLPLPLLPLQILWLNLVTDTFPALALALEPAEPGVMKRPPRDPDASLMSARFLRAMAFYAGLITLATLGAYVWGLGSGDRARAVTLAFMTLALAQLFHLGNARARGPVLTWGRATANRWALAAVPLVIGLQFLAMYWMPLAGVLRTVPLSPADWIAVFGLSAVPAVVGQLLSLRRRDAITAT